MEEPVLLGTVCVSGTELMAVECHGDFNLLKRKKEKQR